MTRVLLDEGVPKPLARKLREVGIDATAFPNSWKALSNGALLDEVVRQGFQVLITNDKRMQFQQNIRRRHLAVVVLPSNRLDVVMNSTDQIVEAVHGAMPGTVSLVAGKVAGH